VRGRQQETPLQRLPGQGVLPAVQGCIRDAVPERHILNAHLSGTAIKLQSLEGLKGVGVCEGKGRSGSPHGLL
jgi:hypothetical protein